MGQFKLGRLPRNEKKRALTFEDYLTEGEGLPVVADTADVDYASKVVDWPMYNNGPDPTNATVCPGSPDGIGDCTIAESAHFFTALRVAAGYPEVHFANSEIVKTYSAISGYNPRTGANDNGCEMSDVLSYQHRVGMVDVQGKQHTVAAYAALGHPNDPTLLSQVLNTFGFVYIGINAVAALDSNFGPGTVWTDFPGSPVEGGHCIGLHRRKPYGSQVGVFNMASWGYLQPATLSFIAAYVEEAWAVFSDDWLATNGSAVNGLNLAQLTADMKLV